MTQTMARRASRGARPSADLDTFNDAIHGALAAFAQDVSYAVAMARAAVTITRKREILTARRELRAAEARARAECEVTQPFTCHAISACGTGDCKFAEGEHAQLLRAAPGGSASRPQHPYEGYSLDEAVAALVDRRAEAL